MIELLNKLYGENACTQQFKTSIIQQFIFPSLLSQILNIFPQVGADI